MLVYQTSIICYGVFCCFCCVSCLDRLPVTIADWSLNFLLSASLYFLNWGSVGCGVIGDIVGVVVGCAVVGSAVVGTAVVVVGSGGVVIIVGSGVVVVVGSVVVVVGLDTWSTQQSIDDASVLPQPDATDHLHEPSQWIWHQWQTPWQKYNLWLH